VPDPGDAHSPDALTTLLTRRRVPLENHAAIAAACGAIGISSLRETSGYIVASRSAPGPDLRIYSGWTEGFTSADEAQALEPNAGVEADGDRPGLFYAKHRANRIGQGGAGGVRSSAEADYGTCPICFLRFSASGACACE